MGLNTKPVIKNNPSQKEIDELTGILFRYNQSKIKNYSYENFIVKHENNLKQMTAAMHCIVGGNWLYINSLWVAPDLRKNGIGKSFIKTAENEALKRNCVGIYLYTYSFQNPEFYVKLGFSRFGSLTPFAGNHEKCYMMKTLVSQKNNY